MAEGEETLSRGVLKMIFCRSVDLMDSEPYERFSAIVCAALGIAVADGRAVSAAGPEGQTVTASSPDPERGEP